jgi:cytidylate kinase
MIFVIYGPQAVGKMTVGQSLAKQLGCAIAHDHMILDIAASLYPYHSNEFHFEKRHLLLDIAKRCHDNNRWLVLTRTFDFNSLHDQLEIEMLVNFQQQADITYVGLESTLSTRVFRNKTRNRLFHKPSKRNVNRSEKRLLAASASFQYYPDQIILNRFSKHIHINNEHLTPKQTARIIIDFIHQSVK